MTLTSGTQRSKGPTLRVSLITLIVGAVIAAPGLVVTGLSLWHQVLGTTYTVPSTVQLHLHEGPYVVFENTATTRSYGVITITNGHGVSIDASQITVTSDDGTPVPVRNSDHTESISRNSDHYESAAEFNAPHAGIYTVRFSTNAKTKVMVQPPLRDLFSRHATWLISIAIGWLTMLIGAVMLIIGTTRRDRADRARRLAHLTSGLPPANWYPDPLGERRLRYWDGSQWTDHYAD